MKLEVRKKGIFLIAGLLLSLGPLAQDAVLEGRIYSRESFENISHANLVLRNSEGLIVTSITTGYDGRYRTDSLEAGAYKIEIHARNYTAEAMEIVYLQPGKLARIDISMELKSSDTEVTASVETEKDEEDENPKPEKKLRLFEILGDIVKTGMVAGL